MFLDIGVGIIAGIFFQTSELFDWYLFFFALGSVLLPDIDMLWYWRMSTFGSWNTKKNNKNKVLDNHRSFTHYPIVYIPLSALVYVFFGSHIAILFSLLILYHFVHDTFFIGWGVKWFWPVSERSFKIFPDRNGKVTAKLMLSWLPSEEQKIKDWAGESNWIKAFYMTPGIIAFVEYPVFLFSLYYLFTILI